MGTQTPTTCTPSSSQSYTHILQKTTQTQTLPPNVSSSQTNQPPQTLSNPPPTLSSPPPTSQQNPGRSNKTLHSFRKIELCPVLLWHDYSGNLSGAFTEGLI